MKEHHGDERETTDAAHAEDAAETPALARAAAARRQRARRGAGAPVQLKASGAPTTDRTQEEASAGVAGAGGELPHLDRIQRAFGAHHVRGVQAHVGGKAAHSAKAIGAAAYTTGDSVAFREPPDLRTAAHEAAHVVQQRRGAVPSGGVGRTGDEHERQADAVADRVVAGGSAEPLFDDLPRGAAGRGVQRLDGKDEDVLGMDPGSFYDFTKRIAKGGKPSEKERGMFQKRLDSLTALQLMELLHALEDQRLLMQALRGTHGSEDGKENGGLKEVPISIFRFWNAKDRVAADVDRANQIYAEVGVRLVVVTVKVITKDEIKKVLNTNDEGASNFAYRADESGKGVVTPTHEDTNKVAAAFGLGSMLTVLYTARVCDYDFEEGLVDKAGVSNPIFCLPHYPRVVAVSSEFGEADTLAHELGHMLIDCGHRDDKEEKESKSKNLMAGGFVRDKEALAERFNEEELVKIRQPIFGWVVEKGVSSDSSALVKKDEKKDEKKTDLINEDL